MYVSDRQTCEHGELWQARDASWRCLSCEPPAFASEIVARKTLNEVLMLPGLGRERAA